MQDIHSIGGGGGRLFGGGGGGGDRRLRTHHHNQNHHHQALKCPRCESLNTKFCYYNNYNLSQPRHFCKNCRRYWTKGGVLRNVPVGGGCRKTKRSKPKSSYVDAPPRERKSNSHSSSESSSLTATTTATAAATTEVASASSSTSASTLLNFPDSRFFNFPQNINPSFDPPLINQSSDGGEFFPEIGTFTSLMTSSSNDPSSLLGFNIADISGSAYRLQQQNHGPVLQNKSSITSTVPEDLKMQEISAGFLDQTAQINLSSLQNRGENGGLGGLDWQAGGESGDQAFFDFTGTVDQGYWSQTQWTDSDHHLYLP